MRQLKQGAKPAQDNGYGNAELVPIEAIASKWEVSTKTVENWSEVVFLAFDIVIPKSGEIPNWAAALLDYVGKHISQKAHLYFSETRESRRLKAAELIQKTHRLIAERHFQEFNQFRQTPQQQAVEDEDDLEMIAELGRSPERRTETEKILEQLEKAEDAQIEKVATFIEESDQRKQNKLARRLATRKRPELPTGEAIDVSFRQVR